MLTLMLTLSPLQAGLRTLQDLAPEMRLALEDEGEGFEGDEEFFRVSRVSSSEHTDP